MEKPLVVIHLRDPSAYQTALAEAGLADRIELAHAAPGDPAAMDLLRRAEAIVAHTVPAGALSEMPRLKWIQAISAGVEGWLTREDFDERFVLTAAHGVHRLQMPENILAALFHLTKPIAAAVVDQGARRWTRRVSEPLAGKTLGILGLGAIGRELARKAAALELRVIGTRRNPGPVPHVDAVHPEEETDAVLAQSDFVLLLLPLTEATRDFMDRDRFRAMREDAYLLNFGRGALVVDDDLIEACETGIIAGALLDVFRSEPLPADHPFWTTEGITVLPHLGGLHPRRDGLVAELVVDNMRRFLADEPLLHVATRERGY